MSSQPRHAARTQEWPALPAGRAPLPLGLAPAAERRSVRPLGLLLPSCAIAFLAVVYCGAAWSSGGSRGRNSGIESDAARRLGTALESCQPDATINLMSDVVICGPRLWSRLKVALAESPDLSARMYAIVADRNAATRWEIPEAEAPPQDEKRRALIETFKKAGAGMLVEARGFKHGAPSLRLVFELLLKQGKLVTVSEATAQEFAYYWAIIGWEVEGPVLVATIGRDRFLFDFDSFGRVAYFELLPSRSALEGEVTR